MWELSLNNFGNNDGAKESSIKLFLNFDAILKYNQP